MYQTHLIFLTNAVQSCSLYNEMGLLADADADAKLLAQCERTLKLRFPAAYFPLS